MVKDPVDSGAMILNVDPVPNIEAVSVKRQ